MRSTYEMNALRFNSKTHRSGGFSMIEILVVLVIVGIIGMTVMMFQTASWRRSNTSNKLLVAGQMIEKKIESLRMNIYADPKHNFPPVDGSLTENGIALSWKFSSVTRPAGSAPQPSLNNVKRCDIRAVWGSGRGDTLIVTTYLAKNF